MSSKDQLSELSKEVQKLKKQIREQSNFLSKITTWATVVLAVAAVINLFLTYLIYKK